MRIPLFFRQCHAWVVLFCAGVCLVLLSADAHAVEPSPQPPCEGAAAPPHERPRHGPRQGSQHGSQHGRANMAIDFKTLDTDGDGFLSFDEFSQSARLSRMDVKKRRKLFDYLDRNNDARLHTRELRFQPPRCIAVLRKEFDHLDSDGSGALNFAEFSKAAPLEKMDEKARKRLFKSLDKNRDQLIQRSELKMKGFHGGRDARNGSKGHHPNHFKKYDVNSSGGLDFDEFSKLWVGRIPENRKKMLFDELDQNNDGEVSPQEVRAAWAGSRKPCSPHAFQPIPEKK